MKRYKEYKASGVEWIGEIPSHWEVKKIKLLTDILSCGLASTPEYVDEGIPFLSAQNVKNGKLDLSKYNNITPSLHRQLTKYKKTKKGDILQVRVGATIGNACIVDVDFDFSIYVSLTHIRCNSSMNNKFMKYILDSHLFKEIALLETFQGGGVGNLNVNVLEKIKLPVPDLNEQEKIANYLDKKTSQIETLISKKEELIEMLKASRSKLISETVTKGLDKNVPMKDSEVEWIGEIPSHWGSSKLKYNLETTKGYAFKSDLFGEEGVPVVKASDIKNKTIVNSDNYINANIANKYKSVILLEGDIIMSTVGSTPDVKNSAVGQIAYIPKNVEGSLLNQNTVILRVNENKLLYNRFLFYILCSTTFRKYLDLYAHGTANQASLSLVDILDFDIVLPSKEEQYKIVDYLDEKISNIDVLILKTEEQIDVLKKAKQKLITEVVTGKIDVTNL